MKLKDRLKQTKYLLPVFAIAFFLAATFIPGGIDIGLTSAAIGTLFGIYIGFTSNNARSKLNKVNELLKAENARNLLVYRLSAAFGQNIRDEVRGMLDTYIIDQIDYKLEDFHRSGKSFRKLHKYISALDVKTAEQKTAHASIISIINQQWLDRSQIEVLVTSHLSRLEWLSIIGLFAGFTLSLWSLSTGNLTSSILLTIVAFSALLLVFILHNNDNLKWQKHKWTWQPLHKLFTHLDLVPYYPIGVILTGEVKIDPGEKIRVARYFSDYPEMKGKKVKTIEYGKDEL